MANVEDRTVDNVANYALELEDQLKQNAELLRKKTEECDYYFQEVERLEDALQKAPYNTDISKELNDKVASLQAAAQEQNKMVEKLQKELKEAKNYQTNQFAYGSFKQYQRLLEVHKREAVVYKAKLRAATAENAKVKREAALEVANAQRELNDLKRDYENRRAKVNVADDILDNCIIPVFIKTFPNANFEEGTNINNIRFDMLCKKAIAEDAKYDSQVKKNSAKEAKKPNARIKVPEQPKHSFRAITEECVKEVEDYLVDLSNQGKVGKAQLAQVINKYKANEQDLHEAAQTITEGIIAENRKWNVKTMVKSRSGVAVLSTVGSVIAAGIVGILLAIVFNGRNIVLTGTNSALKNYATRTDAVAEQTTLSIDSRLNDADTIKNFSYLNATSRAPKARTMSLDTNKVEQGYNQVQQAKANADAIASYNEKGKLDQNSPYAQSLNAYNQAVKDNNTNEADRVNNQLDTYEAQLSDAATQADQGVQLMLQGVDMDMSDILSIMDMLNQPTVSISFSENEVAQYKNLLKNQAAQGKVSSVESCTYYRETGNVEILVKGLNSQYQEYYNLITFKMDANLINPSVADIMNALKNSDNARSQAFDLDLESMSGTTVQMSNESGTMVSGTMSVKYGMEVSYNKESNTTTCKVSALALIDIGGGKTVQLPLTFKLSMQGAHSSYDFKTQAENKIAGSLSNILTMTGAESEAEM